jgi:hypothetical protein
MTAQEPSSIQLRDVTSQTGITFTHTDGSSGQRYIVESVCCGLALLDYDGDGDVDIYFSQWLTIGRRPNGSSTAKCPLPK